MSEHTILWIFGVLISALSFVLAGVIGWISAHNKHCSAQHGKNEREFGEIAAKLDRIINDIGDHNSGLRGQVHKIENDISPLSIMTQHFLRKLQDSIEK